MQTCKYANMHSHIYVKQVAVHLLREVFILRLK